MVLICMTSCRMATYKRKKPFIYKGLVLLLAEREGFEPSVPCSTPDFESGTIDHSATSPLGPRF